MIAAQQIQENKILIKIRGSSTSSTLTERFSIVSSDRTFRKKEVENCFYKTFFKHGIKNLPS